MRILVADDEKIKRVTLAQDLETQGHEVVTAADGAEALEKLLAGHFDVVVTDLKMPKLDGLELLKRIKHDHVTDAEVIIMTAYGSIPLAVEAGKLGTFDFLTKPFRNEDVFPLLARIEAARRGTTRSSPEPLETTIGNIDHAVIGQSPAMRRVRRLIEICTRSDANVLVVRRNRLRQGPDRRDHPSQFPAADVPLRQGRLHAVSQPTDRERTLRPREGRLHRRRAAPPRPFRTGRRRHALPGRRRRHPPGAPGQAPAGHRGEGL